MSNGYTNESLEAILESLESDETDEAVRRRVNGRSAPRTSSFRAPVAENEYVRQRQLKETTDRIDGDISKLNGRVASTETKMERQTAALRKESEERKKDINSLKNNVQLATLLPLLIKPQSRAVTAPVTGTDLQAKDNILVDTGDSLTALLPLLLLGGLGGSSDTSASGGGSFNDPTTLLLVVLAASGGLGGKK